MKQVTFPSIPYFVKSAQSMEDPTVGFLCGEISSSSPLRAQEKLESSLPAL